ncbi:MAG: PAQR family membrane homeostasis protein TrhA [Solirubrobacteraceae bacterium]
MSTAMLAKPRLRGVSHQYGFYASLVCGAALIFTAPGGTGVFAAAIYAAAVSGLLGTSALYHRRQWQPAARRWMRRLDHSMIFVLIAGSYTPVTLLAMSGTLATAVLCVAWGGALVGVALQLVFPDAPKRFSAIVYLALGWVAVATLGQLLDTIGLLAVLAIGLSGALYTAGAVIYASERPNPLPEVFGYHEIFHALVLAAASIHYAIIAFVVLPRG